MSTSAETSAADVRQLVHQRMKQGSLPGRRRDPYRLALCIEGGAMRGVVSAGMVVAIEQLGMLNAFDCIYGSSAGAMNAAFLLAGQAAFGTTIYYENINNRNFIDFARPLSSKPIVDLDFLVWNVMKGPKRLDARRVLESPIPLTAIATDVDSGTGSRFSSWDSEDDLLHCLRAGATMPIVAGAPYAHRGRRFWDALLVEPIPIVTAERERATHAVVLLTRPTGTAGPKLSLAEKAYIVPRLRAVSEALASHYVVRASEYVALLECLAKGVGPSGTTSVLTVVPGAPVVGKLERQRSRLVGGASAGIAAVLQAFGYESHPIHETLRIFETTGHAVTPPAQSTRDDYAANDANAVELKAIRS